ncbi:MAG: hypothetical protein EA391_12565 [Balneolaceae bacterium]|nr:MAG: hypothetical protein EA391_12565 [Balneolaceae bacterium]
MEKLLIGAITVLILLAFVPIKSAPFNVENVTPVMVEINNDAVEHQTLLIGLVESIELDNSELTLAENMVTGNEVTEKKQETRDNDRGVFISIMSLILIGILILLPL